MAERRMFAKTIVDSDAFLDMPLSTQALYFHLNMRADDDGFINNPRKIQRMIGCADDDLRILISKHFVIPFASGVCVIKHWRMHNYIQNDRYKETAYLEEKTQLSIKKNKSYTLNSKTMDTECIQDGYGLETQVRLGKDRLEIGKDSTGDCKGGQAPPPTPTKFIPPSLEEVSEYCTKRNRGVDPQRFIDFYEAKGWMIGKNKMKSWQAAVRTWERSDNPTLPPEQPIKRKTYKTIIENGKEVNVEVESSNIF